MNAEVRTITGCRVLWYGAEGKRLTSEADALDVIAAALGAGTALVAVPVERFASDFFDLSTGLAGAFLQKLVNYGLRLAVVGDLSRDLGESKALRDFVRESNRGRVLCFVADAAGLEERLTASDTRCRGTGRSPS